MSEHRQTTLGEGRFKLHKQTKVVIAAACLAIILLSSFGYIHIEQQTGIALKQGREEGFWFVVNRLKDAGLEVDVEEGEDGGYVVHFRLPSKGIEFNADLEFHMWVRHFRDGKLLSETYHTMTITDYGENWIEDKLAGLNAGSHWGSNATWIACSNNSQSVSTSWTYLPAEATTDGLSRSDANSGDTGDSVASTGTGTWNVTEQFDITGTNSTKLYGLFLNDFNGTTLVAAEQQGVGSQKNLVNGDTLNSFT